MRLALTSLLMGLLTGLAMAASSNSGRVPLERDETYEQNLRWEAGADKTLTPAKVLRWIMSHQGQALSEPSRTEFQPIVNVHDSNVRVVAAIAYKF